MMNSVPNSVPNNLSPALANSFDEARKKLEEAQARKREAIAEALLPKPAKAPQAKLQHHPVAKQLPPPPMAKPKLAVCKDDKCELPGKLFAPAKVTHTLCPTCSRRRKQEAEANRQVEQKVRAEIHEMHRQAEREERLIADLAAGKAFVCVDEGCGTIERPGVGYDPAMPFHCYKCRQLYRASRELGHVPMHDKKPQAIVVEDTATQARKRVKLNAEEFFREGGETALPKGVSLHQRLDRQITLKFVNGGETFYHNFVLAQSREDKRAKDATAQKRRIDNRHATVSTAPKHGNKNHKDGGKKKGRK